MLKLTIEDDEGKTTVIPVIRDEMTIGRQEGNTIRLTERNVSRRHARLLRQNGVVYVEDLASFIGVKLNGSRITAVSPIREGDELLIGDYKIVTTLCPGGKERMRRLMSMVQTKRFDPTPLLTHRFKLDQVVEAYDLFGSRRDGVLKVAIRP